jgi:hypothetical protein
MGGCVGGGAGEGDGNGGSGGGGGGGGANGGGGGGGGVESEGEEGFGSDGFGGSFMVILGSEISILSGGVASVKQCPSGRHTPKRKQMIRIRSWAAAALSWR